MKTNPSYLKNTWKFPGDPEHINEVVNNSLKTWWVFKDLMSIICTIRRPFLECIAILCSQRTHWYLMETVLFLRKLEPQKIDRKAYPFLSSEFLGCNLHENVHLKKKKEEGEH